MDRGWVWRSVEVREDFIIFSTSVSSSFRTHEGEFYCPQQGAWCSVTVVSPPVQMLKKLKFLSFRGGKTVGACFQYIYVSSSGRKRIFILVGKEVNFYAFVESFCVFFYYKYIYRNTRNIFVSFYWIFRLNIKYWFYVLFSMKWQRLQSVLYR